MNRLKLVVVESPLRGYVPTWVPMFLAPAVERFGRWRNRLFAIACVRDSVMRGEAPYASHLLFDQRGLLDDSKKGERQLGMEAGFAWGEVAEIRAVYCDRGISSGMRAGIDGRPSHQIVEYRYLVPPRDRPG